MHLRNEVKKTLADVIFTDIESDWVVRYIH